MRINFGGSWHYLNNNQSSSVKRHTHGLLLLQHALLLFTARTEPSVVRDIKKQTKTLCRELNLTTLYHYLLKEEEKEEDELETGHMTKRWWLLLLFVQGLKNGVKTSWFWWTWKFAIYDGSEDCISVHNFFIW